MKRVYGKYSTLMEARRVVEELLDKGYTQNQIKVVSNEDLGKNLSGVYNENQVDDRSLWEKIKDAFTFHEYDDDNWDRDLNDDDKKVVETYRNDLKNGAAIVLVEEGVQEDKFEPEEKDEQIIIIEGVETFEVPIIEEEILVNRIPPNDSAGFEGEIVAEAYDEVWDGIKETDIPVEEDILEGKAPYDENVPFDKI